MFSTDAVSVQHKLNELRKYLSSPINLVKQSIETTVLDLCMILLSNTKTSRKKTKQVIQSSESFENYTVICLFKYLIIFFYISVATKRIMVRKEYFILVVNLNEKFWKCLSILVKGLE